MFLTGLALLPAIALVVWIYRQDKVEKEPISLLVNLVIFGMISIVPAVIGGTVLELVPNEVASVSGNYTAHGAEDIQRKVEEAYRNNNPLGL